ncbi:hypothetical protein OCH7691_03031 [Oceanibacterium hippocampi]|uniref:Uncharacterized protein n=1 Tax=Oceanibacterium hippocampi TaxID=745714 RepID=A0A1Y5TKX6_9PROT|nr:hypothetical protein OCH7691_03031 [Oceanibacterium hippocampi]
MLSAADFADLFPAMAESVSGRRPDRAVPRPSAACIARWEDDGGWVPEPSRGEGPTRRNAAPGRRMASSLAPGVLLSLTPAVAVLGGAAAVLSLSRRLLES